MLASISNVLLAAHFNKALKLWCVFGLYVINAVYAVFAINLQFTIAKIVEEKEEEEEKMSVKTSSSCKTE